MRNPESFGKMFLIVSFVMGVVFTAFAVSSYVAFLDTVQPIVINNLPRGSGLYIAVSVILVVELLLSFPLVFFPISWAVEHSIVPSLFPPKFEFLLFCLFLVLINNCLFLFKVRFGELAFVGVFWLPWFWCWRRLFLALRWRWLSPEPSATHFPDWFCPRCFIWLCFGTRRDCWERLSILSCWVLGFLPWLYHRHSSLRPLQTSLQETPNK